MVAFEKNAAGKTDGNLNLFLSAEYRQGNSHPGSYYGVRINQFLSAGYLISQRGSVFDKNTIRLSIGGVNYANGAAYLQPVFFFHDFIRGMSPGVCLKVRL